MPEGSSTRPEVQFTSRPLTLLARLIAPPGWMMAHPSKSQVERDLEDLKTFVQSPNGDTSLESYLRSGSRLIILYWMLIPAEGRIEVQQLAAASHELNAQSRLAT
jgi:hypothetical protein